MISILCKISKQLAAAYCRSFWSTWCSRPVNQHWIGAGSCWGASTKVTKSWSSAQRRIREGSKRSACYQAWVVMVVQCFAMSLDHVGSPLCSWTWRCVSVPKNFPDARSWSVKLVGFATSWLGFGQSAWSSSSCNSTPWSIFSNLFANGFTTTVLQPITTCYTML